MKIVFMGTPDFAVPPLKALVEAGYDVAAVVTQPDKPKGRGKSLLPTPVKEEALLHEIPVYQPQRVRNNREFLDTLREIAPDVIVVAAFGQIIPRDVLELPKYGCINIHASLLPKIQRSCPHPAGCDRWRKRIRCYHHADGRGAGYRRYDLKDCDPSGKGGNRRKSFCKACPGRCRTSDQNAAVY